MCTILEISFLRLASIIYLSTNPTKWSNTLKQFMFYHWKTTTNLSPLLLQILMKHLICCLPYVFVNNSTNSHNVNSGSSSQNNIHLIQRAELSHRQPNSLDKSITMLQALEVQLLACFQIVIITKGTILHPATFSDVTYFDNTSSKNLQKFNYTFEYEKI